LRQRWLPQVVEVEFVVNNAGFGVFGRAIERDRAEQLGIIAVNIRALTDLSLRFSNHLIRHRGGILNVGSIAGFLPGLEWPCTMLPKHMYYHSRKRSELAPYGVRVPVLCPGPVQSPFRA
jgi:uncharacterized protein